MKRELAECQFPRSDRLISNGLRLGVTSTNVASVTVKNSDSRRVPITAARTQGSGQLLPSIDKSCNNNSNHFKKRKRSQESTATVATTLSSSNIDKSVVSDDDDSVSNDTMDPSNSTKRKRMKDSTKNYIAVPPPLTPLPLKLKTSQIHSKKYPFPHKLFDLLKKESTSERSSEVVSWLPDETTFVVHNHARFAAEFLPAYFGHTQLRSFDRQLHYWGFELVSPRTINNTSFGGKSWKHPFFQKDRKDLLKQVNRKIVGGSSSSQKPPSSKKKIKNKNKKSRSVTPTRNKTTSRIVDFHQKISVSETDGNTAAVMSINMNTSLHMKKTPKNSSRELGLRPRMVSPVYGVPCAATYSDSPAKDIIVSALDIVELDNNSHRGNVADKYHSAISVDIKDDILSLFPLELFKDDNNHEQEKGTTESVGAKGIVPIPRQELFVDSKTILRGGKVNDVELCPKVEVFEGNSFHDVDLTLDMGINVNMDVNVDTNVDMSMDIDIDIDIDMEINMDEAELFLNIIEDNDNNEDDYFLCW
jgi:hypothetical protein